MKLGILWQKWSVHQSMTKSVKAEKSSFRFLSKRKMASKETRRGVEEEDLANVEFETSEDVEVIPTFDSMALREDLLR